MRLEVDRPVILNQVFSPYGIALVSTLVFMGAVLFPPRIYSNLLSEPDLIFLDAQTASYFLLCICGFFAGLLLIDFVSPAVSLLQSELKSERWHPLLLGLPLVFTTLVTCVEIVVIAKTYPSVLSLLLAQEGDAVKQEAQNIQLGPLAFIDFMHVGVLWWTFAKSSRADLTRGGRMLIRAILVTGLTAKVALSILVVSRAALMPVVGGLAVLYLLIRIQQKKLTLRKLMISGVTFTVALLMVFFAVGLLRGGGDPAKAGADLLGYTLASYNRLAALLHGVMRYPYGGHGVYLSNYLDYDKRVNFILPLKKTLNWPEFLELWNSEFQAPQLAGLNPNLIWSGAFGYLFADFGWATPFVMAGYGILYAFVWRAFKSGRTAGYVLYPWFAYCALSWFSVNLVFDSAIFVFCITVFLLTVYQKMLGALRLGIRPSKALHSEVSLEVTRGRRSRGCAMEPKERAWNQ